MAFCARDENKGTQCRELGTRSSKCGKLGTTTDTAIVYLRISNVFVFWSPSGMNRNDESCSCIGPRRVTGLAEAVVGWSGGLSGFQERSASTGASTSNHSQPAPSKPVSGTGL